MLSIITVATTAGLVGSQPFGAFEIVIVGFLFVSFILLILSLTTWALGKFFVRLSIAASPVPMVAGAASISSPVDHASSERSEAPDLDVSDPHHVVVIAAAIHCMMQGREHRIVSIRSSDSAWAAEGRRQIFSSRKVR